MIEQANSLTPIITLKELQEAYKSLSKANLLDYNPLRGFILVKQKALLRYHAEDDDSLAYATEHTLIDLVADHLTRLRQIYDLVPPNLDASLSQIIDEIQSDAQTYNTQLIGFSYLYFRYVRSDLELSLEQFEDYYAQGERNLRRYEKRSFERLRQALIEAELENRRVHWQELARRKLPKFHSIQLAGQSQYAKNLGNQFIYHNLTHLYIYGSNGCGKSSLACLVAMTLIDEFLVQHIVYLNFSQIESAPSREAFQNLVEAQLEIPTGHSLDAYLAILAQHNQRILIVLDDMAAWYPVLRQVAPWFSHCLVIATDNSPLGNWVGREVECPLLNRDDSLRFLAYHDSNYPQKLSESTYFKIFDDIGGHPQKLKLALHYYDKLGSVSRVIYSVQREDYLQKWHALNEIQQMTWIMLNIMQTEMEKIYQSALLEAWQSHLNLDEKLALTIMSDLLQAGLMMWRNHDVEHTYFIEDEVSKIIENTLVYQANLQSLLEYDLGEYQFALLEQIAMQTFDYEMIQPLLFKVKEEVLFSGTWQRWQNLLTALRQHPLDPVYELEIELEKAIAWRWAGQFERALTQLGMVISHSRRQQIHSIYIEALIEESNVQHWLDQADVAYQSALEAHALLKHINNPELKNRCIIALAQSQIQSNPQEASRLLAQITEPDAQTWDVLARVQMALQQRALALELASQSVQAIADTPHHPAYPRAIGLYARLLDFNHQYHQAVREFNYAIHLLQINQDWLGLARLYTNYSIACVHYAKEILDENRDEYIRVAEQSVRHALELHKNLQDPHSYKIAKQTLLYVKQAQQSLSHHRPPSQ